jgi:hypothetical protein
LDCRLFNDNKISDIKTRTEFAYDDIIVVLSNLAIRKDKRGLGFAKKLIQACEPIVKVIFNIFLFVL